VIKLKVVKNMNGSNEFHTVRGYQLLQHENTALTSAMEDYLEMIYRNCLKDGYMRINMLADLLNVQASSATKMVQKIAALGFLKYERYGIIQLTDSGKRVGEYLLRRHEIIETFLKLLGVKENILKETELIEHNISASTLERIELINTFFNENPDIFAKFKEFTKDFT